jgi:hypothetical protein
LSAGAHESIAEETYRPVIGAITRLLDSGKAAGRIREDADPADYLQFTGALWRARPERIGPMLDLIHDGLAVDRNRSAS